MKNIKKFKIDKKIFKGIIIEDKAFNDIIVINLDNQTVAKRFFADDSNKIEGYLYNPFEEFAKLIINKKYKDKIKVTFHSINVLEYIIDIYYFDNKIVSDSIDKEDVNKLIRFLTDINVRYKEIIPAECE